MRDVGPGYGVSLRVWWDELHGRPWPSGFELLTSAFLALAAVGRDEEWELRCA